jgi:hypothetical protein
MSSPTILSATVCVANEAQFPIVELAVTHWQTSGDYQAPTTWTYYSFEDPAQAPYKVDFRKDSLYDGDKRTPLLISFNEPFKFDSGQDDYWTIAWRNMHDPCLYYLIKDLSDWQKFTQDVINTMDTLIGAAVDIVTDSPIGTVGSLAVNAAVNSIYESSKGSDQIKCKMDTDSTVLVISLPCDRSKYALTGHDTTNCSAQTYMPLSNNTCHA